METIYNQAFSEYQNTSNINEIINELRNEYESTSFIIKDVENMISALKKTALKLERRLFKKNSNEINDLLINAQTLESQLMPYKALKFELIQRIMAAEAVEMEQGNY